MKRIFLLLALCLTGFGVTRAADTPQTDHEGQILFATYQRQRPYRIPAIATTRKGELLAISDDRYCGSDIGYGRVDIVGRISTDNGVTWGDQFNVAVGDGDNNSNTCGYGDAAIVADRESNKVLVLAVCGKTVCWNGNYTLGSDSNPNRVAKVVGTYNETSGEWE